MNEAFDTTAREVTRDSARLAADGADDTEPGGLHAASNASAVLRSENGTREE